MYIVLVYTDDFSTYNLPWSPFNEQNLVLPECSLILLYVLGSNHKLMSLKELSCAMKESLKPQKKEAEELFDKWSAVLREATITLSNWDTETEHGVRLIGDTEQKQVIVMCMTPSTQRFR